MLTRNYLMMINGGKNEKNRSAFIKHDHKMFLKSGTHYILYVYVCVHVWVQEEGVRLGWDF